MSQKEFQRVKVIENEAGGKLSVGEASRLLQLSERQVQRLKRRYRPDSVGWVQHGNRGRPMPWALPLPQKQLILHLARSKYQGFNDSHRAEKLRREENLTVSRETVRRLLCAASCGPPNWPPRSGAGLVPAARAARPARASAGWRSPMPAIMTGSKAAAPSSRSSQVEYQPSHHRPILPLPPRSEPAKSRFRLGAAFRQVHRLRGRLPFVIALPYFLQDVPPSCAPSSADGAPADKPSQSPPLNPGSRR